MAGPEVSDAVIAIGRLTRVEWPIGFDWLHVVVPYSGLTPPAVGQYRVRPPDLSNLACAKRPSFPYSYVATRHLPIIAPQVVCKFDRA
jgi:hypothetical protein